MSEQPFSFTDKRKLREDGEAQPDLNPAEAAPQQDEPGKAAPSADVPEQEEADEVEELDELSAEAGQLYSDAVSEADSLKTRVAELEEQLKRDQAEYVNSRRRIEQSAIQSQKDAVAKVMSSLLSVLDEIELARQHGDLADGTPFAAIASKLEEALKGHGLERFGEQGEDFDPARHEALMHTDDAEATSTTLGVVMQPGYTFGERVLRPARVGTVGPN